MKNIKLALTVVTTLLTATIQAQQVEQVIQQFDEMEIKKATSSEQQHILIVKWKDRQVHYDLMMTPETRRLQKTDNKSALLTKLNITAVGNRKQGLEVLSKLYQDTGIALKHVRSSSLNTDIFATAKGYTKENVVKDLMSTGLFEYVKVDIKVGNENVSEITPINIKTGKNALDKDKFNDPVYLQETYLDEQQAGARGNHSILKANAYAKENNNLGRKVRIAVIDSGFWEHEDVDYSGSDGADFVTAFGFDRYEDCDAVDASNTGADITCSIANFKDDVRDLDPTDKSWDFNKDSSGNPTTDGDICIDGHGLNVASTITAVRNNGLGLVSATDNNDVTIIPIRALGCDGGFSSDTADAIVWAAGGAVPGMGNIAGPVDIINLSLGGFAGFLCDERSFYKEAVEFAQSQGVVVVASAGNAFIDVKDFQPASCDGVLAVGSNDIRGELSNFSNYGDEIDVTFSGENINVAVINQFIYADAAASELCEINDATPTVNNCYGKTGGTSFSSPLAAASLALIKMVKPEATESELRALISSSASFYTVDDFGMPTLRSTLMKNAGIGNAYESLIMDLDFLTIENLAAVHLFDKFETESETKYLEELAAITDIERLCSSYHLSWGNYRNAVSNVEYFIYASNSSEPSLTIDNSTLITTSTDLTDITATVGNFTRVGVLSTVEDQSGDIFEFDLSDAPKPTFCL